VSSGSASGSGADEHLLALLRAIRLRQAAPDAAAAGSADAAAALTSAEGLGRSALTPGEAHEALTAAPERPELTAEARPGPVTGKAVGRPDAVTGAAVVRPGWAVAPEAALVRPGESAEPAGDADVDDRAGQLSRNRFAGLTPARIRDDRGEPTPRVPDDRAEPRPRARSEEDASPAAGKPAPPGRPPWASAEPGATFDPAGGFEATSRSEATGGFEATGAFDPAGAFDGARPPRIEGITAPLVAAAPGRSAAVDGMDPADDALLRQTQRLLRESLDFAGGAAAVATRLRAALVTASPGLFEALPGDAATQTERLAEGLTWLVDHLDQPPTLVDGSSRLGAALAACGVEPAQLQFAGAAIAEAIRAGSGPGEWRQEFELAWRSTWQHLYEWILHGEATAGYEPPVWTARVVSHQLRRPDLAVVKLRPYLPMPFRPGQYARVEVDRVPGVWRPYSLAGAPRRDDLVELHVRAKTETGVSGTLVHHTRVGDEVRIGRAEGEMGLPDRPDRDLLMIAGDTGVAPLKALLTELADTGDPRSAVLFWGVRDLGELYDIDEIAEIARSAKRATVVPVVSEGDPGPYASGLVTDAVAAYGEWSRHEVYLAGPPLMLAATGAALRLLGVTADRIHHDAPE
jgi:NAD(P)H-flavin reductase